MNNGAPPISLSSLDIPFPAPKNPLGHEAEELAKGIALRVGLLRPALREVLRFSGFNSLPSHVFPSAPLEALVACCQWCDWQFFFDDECDDDRAFGADLVKLRRLMEAYLDVLRGGVPQGAPTPLTAFTLDLRQRLLGLSSGAWLQRFTSSVEDYLLRGSLPAVRNWRDNFVPSIEDYMAQREYDSGVYTTLDLIELTSNFELPANIIADPFVQRMRHLCTRVVAFTNDVVSFQKEVLKNQNPNNLIHVLMIRRSCSFPAAAAEALAIINADVQEFIHSRKNAPAFPPDVAPMITLYLDGMEHWMRGNLDWSLSSPRYKAPDSPFEELRTQGQTPAR
nr:terpene cyclase [Myxococcales bacterium]